MPPGPSQRQQEENAARRWTWIAEELRAETAKFSRRGASSARVRLLRRMAKAAHDRDAESLTTLGREYVKRTRVLPPGIYANCAAPGKTFYLPGERLETGRRVATLDFAVVHPQVYR